MRNKNFWSSQKIRLAIVAQMLILVSGSWAATEQVLASLGSGVTGGHPQGGVIFDSAGNLYGTAAAGGDYKACTYGCGVVFELTPSSGGWIQTTIHTFNGKDGDNPAGTLVFDQAGSLYGTTQFGGADNRGVVFELTPTTGGGWTEKVLHSFAGDDGELPHSGLIMDAAGDLYGTTEFGGSRGQGVAFELLPTSTGWRHKVLRNFGLHGIRPYGGLVLDQMGNLYGTTTGGGNTIGGGVVFELTPNAKGVWNELVLYEFRGRRRGGKDGRYPVAALIFDGQGNLYGTTVFGGVTHHGRGTIFKLTPSTSGPWKETELHYGGRKGGYGYLGALTFDAAGNLYGTAYAGGGNSLGAIFRLEPTKAGFWMEKVIYSFQCCSDGRFPEAGLIRDAGGNLFGTTTDGGTYDDGAVFEITP